jgi:hypothetical protein
MRFRVSPPREIVAHRLGKVGKLKQPTKRRPRKVTLMGALRQADKAGHPAKSAISHPDGRIELHFAESGSEGIPIETPEQLRKLI